MKTSILLGVFIFMSGCKNDITEVMKLSAKVDSAIVSAKEYKMKYTVEGNLKVMMSAPVLNRYIEQGGKTYTDFPDGVHLKFYNDQGVETSTLKANYSIFWESDGIWEAEYNVEVTNEKGEKLNTEYLIWHQKKEEISTDRDVKMTTTDGVIYGKGLVSNQDFTSWEIIDGHGVIDVEEYE